MLFKLKMEMDMAASKKIVMSDEIREKFAGLLPMRKDAIHSFTPELLKELPDEYQPVIRIRQFDNDSIIKIKGMMYEEATMVDSKSKKKAGQKLISELKTKSELYIELLHEILDGWDNLYDVGSGEVFEYDGDIETIYELPEVLRTEILSEAIKISGFLPKEILA